VFDEEDLHHTTETALTVTSDWTMTQDPAQHVRHLLVLGVDATVIRSILKKKHPRANIDKLFTAAAEYFRTVGNADPLVVRGWALDAYRDLYFRMVQAEDFASAAKVIEKLEQLARNP
jgi:hypothetical protein